VYTIMLHIANEEPIVGETEKLPEVADTLITIKNPRRRDGKDLTNLESNVSTIMLPLHRIVFIEVMPTGEEEDIIGFVRE
jgi:hypothetical protein